MSKLNIIVLDGASYHYIENMPFVQKLSQNGTYIKYVKPPFGFCEREVIFSGKSPKELGKFSIYSFSQKSPFRWAKPLIILASILPNERFATLLRRIITFATKKLYNFYCVYTHEVPLLYLPSLDFQDDKTRIEETLPVFKKLRTKRVGVNYCMWPIGNSDEERLKRFLYEKKDINIMQFSDVDYYGHKFGPYSREMGKKMFEIDQLLQRSYNPKENYIIFGDHGMVSVKEEINILQLIAQEKIKDYIPIIDSTIARFRIKGENRKKLVRLLSKLRLKGKFIDYQDADKYEIQLDKHEKDVMFLLKPGYIFVPSFFEKHKGGTKGMHGYFDQRCVDNNGFLVSSVNMPKYRGRESIGLKEVFSIIKFLLQGV